MIKAISKQTRRLVLDVVIALGLMAFYLTEVYASFPAPVQLISLKVILVSLGFVHAHIVGKLAFPRVEWTESVKASHVLRIALYVVFIYAYSTGGYARPVARLLDVCRHTGQVSRVRARSPHGARCVLRAGFSVTL